MTALATFANALADGGSVHWEKTPPSVRVSSKWASVLRDQPAHARAELRAVLQRAAVFRGQLQESVDGPTIPYLMLPMAGEPRPGACISCGVTIQGRWRCWVCLMAVYIALDNVTALVEIASTESGADL